MKTTAAVSLKNFSVEKRPVIKNPNDIVDKLTSDYRAVFGEKLLSVVMYGCAVTHEYVPGSSSINIFLLVTDSSLEHIHNCMDIHKYWYRRGVMTPLIMSRDFFETSLDLYPVDYLHIQSNYRVLFGEDVFSTLDIQKEHLRMQCERELKQLSLNLREEYLQADCRKRILTDLLEDNIKRLFPLFKALLVIYGRKIPHARSELISSVEDLFGLGVSVLSDIYHGKRGLDKGCIHFYHRLTEVIDLIVGKVNQLKGREAQPLVT